MTGPHRPREWRGATAVEYALLSSLIAAVIVAAVLLFGGSVTDLFSNTATSVQDGMNP